MQSPNRAGSRALAFFVNSNDNRSHSLIGERFLTMYICICAAVTDHEIREKIAEGAHTLDDLSMELGVGLGCGTCVHAAEKLLFETRARLISLESVKINLRDVRAAANMDASVERAAAPAATTAEQWPRLERA